MSQVKWTPRQMEARRVLCGPQENTLLEGGSRSGKSFVIVRQIVTRAIKAPGSRHAIMRHRFNACKTSIALDTYPKVLQLCFPGLAVDIDKTDWFARIPGGSEIWFGGLDDKERTEKILGKEYSTIMLNEMSQISYNSYGIAKTRLAQKVACLPEFGGGYLSPKMFGDCNPPSKAHWSYKLFHLGLDPETKKPINNANDYAFYKLNPIDNIGNISPEYLKSLESLPDRLKRRFLDGNWADATPNQLFSEENIDRYRVTDGVVPDLLRIVVAVDPSGSGDKDNADNDAIGIIVGGLGIDGNAYLLEDCTVKCGPSTWGKVVTDAYDRHGADIIVGENNYGGEMVKHVIRTSKPGVPYKAVCATRGKAVRAEPFSALYENGKVRHVGNFYDLEDELVQFSTMGYLGEHSPNRADAMIWMLTELFPAMTRKKTKHMKIEFTGWQQ